MKTQCCIVGGGPAGVMLGYLLARRGIGVTVLEKHNDFFRDFRGDTVHPSTLELLSELGILDEFLQTPHQELPSVSGIFGDYSFKAADFHHVPTRCKFIALMPQWDFLAFLSRQAQKFPAFTLLMGHEATEVIEAGGRITGVIAKTANGPVQIDADLVVGCDGRHSLTRQAAHFRVQETGVPIDVLWFRMSRLITDPERGLGNVNYGNVLVLINRADYFQAGLIVPKGSFEALKREGLEAFQDKVRRIAPFLGDRVKEVSDWDQVKLLTVQINCLERWYRPGLLCIGDAAHAMSPAGGVGINLALQDAVATANLLAPALRQGQVTEEQLARVQQRRIFPTLITQRLQGFAHKGIQKIFQNPGPAKAPWQLRAITGLPIFPRIMGRVIGMGVRPEHIEPRSNPLVPIAVSLGAAAGSCVKALRPVLTRV